MKTGLFRSFKAKITLAFIASMLFAVIMDNFLIYRFTLNSQFNDLRNKLMIIAQTSALMVDADMLERVPLNKEGVESIEFKAVADKLRKIRKVNSSLKYIYILTKTEQEGVWQFIVDIDLPGAKGRRQIKSAYPGDKYNAERFPEMLKAFGGPTADKKLEIDEWGITLSGYAPIREADGKAIAILGVDIMADDVYALQKQVRYRALAVLILGIILSLVLAILISGMITERVKKLVEGTRHIAGGELGYRIQIKGNDEISELGESFNQMASRLFESRKRILTYFYQVVQSLVRILEARDHYTRGHSERVAEYAGKIAAKMGFSPDRIELLKEATLLHDIGKIGIQENLLNKQGKLTDEEWEEIKKHSLIGEDILKPVALSEEMLEIVRAHHERYDGTGYPNKLKGENIGIFAAIVSVADAYDAMTSSRAYRAALTKEQAIEELRKNSGTQFNPQVVDTFIQILEEQK